ncbi:MAG: FHA domain-containing protein [Lachnospiraceae bacterium]|nr:FHA domain-containing protein [Lachnospiraceae bacterium]
MLNVEYVRSLNCNYERILLDKMPEERKYQYSILGRCQVKGLLPCNLRYIDGKAYLYYDISSRQNVALLYANRCITREWVRDFLWSLRHIRQELSRYLLDVGNIIWHPEQIFQELENNVFSFLYIPYYEGESGFMKLMEFWVEHIDYNDEVLVDCVYRMYERTERNGEVYLQTQIFEDAECLEDIKLPELAYTVVEETRAEDTEEDTCEDESASAQEKPAKAGRKGIRGILEGKRIRSQKAREDYRESMQREMAGYEHAVAEKVNYESTYGQTVFFEDKAGTPKQPHRLLTPEGRLFLSLEQASLTIGKKKGEVDLVLQDSSVSRLHARITREGESIYLEDLNSTNGTFQNDKRMHPYEKKKLEEGDEIKFGKVVFIFR